MSISTSSLNRITGLASGLDTDALVKKLMSGNQAKIDQLKQNQQKKLWLSESYRQWNSELNSFRNLLNNAKLSSTFNTFSVTSSQPDSITATSGGGSISGTYNVQVNKLADSAVFKGTGINIDRTKSLGDAAQGAFQLTGNTTFELTVNNDPARTVSISIDPTTDKIEDVISKINSATDTNGKSLGLQAFYDATLKQFVVKSKSTGESQEIKINTSDDTMAKYFGQVSAGTYTAKGQNADIVFNGESLSLETNSATIMGINWTFKSPTVDGNGAPKAAIVNLTKDIDAQVKNIKDIINSYNEILSKLTKAKEEPVYRDFLPLTDDQRASMSEDQIKQWEAKAKSGLMRGDNILGSLLSNLRSDMLGKVNNGSAYNSLASIGISSGRYDKGVLKIDETKLRAAIEADPDAIQKLFTQAGNSNDGTKGLLNTISDRILKVNTNLTDKAGSASSSQYDTSTIGKMLSQIQNKIKVENDRYVTLENRYYKQFTAMESALTKYSSQSSWLYSQTS